MHIYPLYLIKLYAHKRTHFFGSKSETENSLKKKISVYFVPLFALVCPLCPKIYCDNEKTTNRSAKVHRLSFLNVSVLDVGLNEPLTMTFCVRKNLVYFGA